MADEIPLKPGTYRLARDVENPKPDRRFKGDWRFAPVWKAGTEFLVTVRYPDLDDEIVEGVTPEVQARLRELRKVVNIALVGYRWTHHHVSRANPEAFRALALNLEPCGESHEALFTRLDLGSGEYFARWLVETGRLSHEQFALLYEQHSDDGQMLAKEYETNAPQRPQFRISDIDAEIDRRIVEHIEQLTNRSGAV